MYPYFVLRNLYCIQDILLLLRKTLKNIFVVSQRQVIDEKTYGGGVILSKFWPVKTQAKLTRNKINR